MSKCINCDNEATSWDNLWCPKCLGDNATEDDMTKQESD
jgi:predicted nucleic-acid-binding Zn-ribbon protein